MYRGPAARQRGARSSGRSRCGNDDVHSHEVIFLSRAFAVCSVQEIDLARLTSRPVVFPEVAICVGSIQGSRLRLFYLLSQMAQFA
jgi:hypothetical protein